MCINLFSIQYLHAAILFLFVILRGSVVFPTAPVAAAGLYMSIQYFISLNIPLQWSSSYILFLLFFVYTFLVFLVYLFHPELHVNW